MISLFQQICWKRKKIERWCRMDGRGRPFGERKMYPAKCSDCGADCEVPFEPKQDRPVYCRECFKKHRKF